MNRTSIVALTVQSSTVELWGLKFRFKLDLTLIKYGVQYKHKTNYNY